MKITVELLRKKKLQGFVMAHEISLVGPAMVKPTFLCCPTPFFYQSTGGLYLYVEMSDSPAVTRQ